MLGTITLPGETAEKQEEGQEPPGRARPTDGDL